jgi:hypothetical protein
MIICVKHVEIGSVSQFPKLSKREHPHGPKNVPSPCFLTKNMQKRPQQALNEVPSEVKDV